MLLGVKVENRMSSLKDGGLVIDVGKSPQLGIIICMSDNNISTGWAGLWKIESRAESSPDDSDSETGGESGSAPSPSDIAEEISLSEEGGAQ